MGCGCPERFATWLAHYLVRIILSLCHTKQQKQEHLTKSNIGRIMLTDYVPTSVSTLPLVRRLNHLSATTPNTQRLTKREQRRIAFFTWRRLGLFGQVQITGKKLMNEDVLATQANLIFERLLFIIALLIEQNTGRLEKQYAAIAKPESLSGKSGMSVPCQKPTIMALR